MRTTVTAGVIVAALLVAACSPGVAPPASPSTTLTTPMPTPAAPQPSFFPLPPGIIVEPGPDAPSASIEASSRPGAEVGVIYRFDLGHCGLGSPFDFDGSLWDPLGALDREGGPVDADAEHVELLNAASGEVILVDPDHAQFRTPLGTVVALKRHAGAKEYSLCD